MAPLRRTLSRPTGRLVSTFHRCVVERLRGAASALGPRLAATTGSVDDGRFGAPREPGADAPRCRPGWRKSFPVGRITDYCRLWCVVKVKGDFVECGVWRGGASIFAKAVIQPHRPLPACTNTRNHHHAFLPARPPADAHPHARSWL